MLVYQDVLNVPPCHTEITVERPLHPSRAGRCSAPSTPDSRHGESRSRSHHCRSATSTPPQKIGLQPAGATSLRWWWRSAPRGLSPSSVEKDQHPRHLNLVTVSSDHAPETRQKHWSTSDDRCIGHAARSVDRWPPGDRWGMPGRETSAGPSSTGPWSQDGSRPVPRHATPLQWRWSLTLRRSQLRLKEGARTTIWPHVDRSVTSRRP